MKICWIEDLKTLLLHRLENDSKKKWRIYIMNKKQKVHLVDILNETESRLDKAIKNLSETYKGGWIKRSEIYFLLNELEEIKGKLITTDIVRMSEQLKWMGSSLKYYKHKGEI